MRQSFWLNIPFKLMTLFLCFLLSSCLSFEPSYAFDYQLEDNSILINTSFGKIKYSIPSSGSIEVHYLQDDIKQFPSFSKQELLIPVKPIVNETNTSLTLLSGALSAVIQKADLSVSFYRGSDLLIKQQAYFFEKNRRGFSFEIDDTEKILGGGERVLGMNRRGHRMPLYNRAHYGYSTHSYQMYFGLPLITSSKKYSLLFDNSASGFLDIAKSKENTLTFEAVGGRTSYIVFSGETYPELINNYVNVTGKQPMPPRWAFGNFASRFGYRTQQQVENTIDQFIADDIPVDAVILDLYWFGNAIKGFMGNLNWDKETFPMPIKMINKLKQQGVKTILITEPFVLSSSDKWLDAVDKEILTKGNNGLPKRFDFYFGNTGLIDVFDQKAQDWFGKTYEMLSNQGVAGVWGDLGEPEVHPDDSIHYLSKQKMTARGDEIHNAFGHQWAKIVFEKQLELKPEVRPFIMMRSGFAGSQRYGMIPWTGDVSRSWDGLKPQVELSLQMGLSGLGYTHSDLGGFAGGEKFDKEMYIRWLQYGIFQPVFRPHAHDNIAPEPIYHDKEAKDIIREFIKLRYRMLPYNYTLAYKNSTSGLPLMRPVFFEDESDPSLIDVKDTYFWGDSLLVSPIVIPNEKTHSIELPAGVWFDYWSDKVYQGKQTINFPVSLLTLPVLVRGGAFIPMVDDMQTTDDYSSKKINLHYYADASVVKSSYEMYEDDGTTYGSVKKEEFELLNFSSVHDAQSLKINFSRKGTAYHGRPQSREIEIVIHNWLSVPSKLSFAGRDLKETDYSYDVASKLLTLSITWNHQNAQLAVE